MTEERYPFSKELRARFRACLEDLLFRPFDELPFFLIGRKEKEDDPPWALIFYVLDASRERVAPLRPDHLEEDLKRVLEEWGYLARA